MNKRQAALVQGLIAAHRGLLESVERSIAGPTTPQPVATREPDPTPLDAEDETETTLAEVATAEEIDFLRVLSEGLATALDGGTMPRSTARYLAAFVPKGDK